MRDHFVFATIRHLCIGSLSLAVTLTGFTADNPFAAGVREADPQSPSDQQKSFTLPPGFTIELVASEPDIAKPMNLAFDAQGRLWVTDSYEYPFAAPLDQPGKDAIKVLEDTTGDGDYDQITTFADGLNIPIGLYPYKNGVIAWSIPYISFYEDTDNDGKSDRQTQLYGPLGYERDTHGMNSSFTRGFDGWLYVTHGFNNNTTVRGADGSEISMNSGNTYRIRLDGSRVEQFTFGQVNPFGMTLDPLGNLYTSDCHTMPAYLLVRDAYYPSFGKPHDGLGFCPKIMDHSHGSTAIDGVVYYSDNQWPLEYRDNVFIGNVMTSRVNRDTLFEVGSGKWAKEEEDFVKTTDSWFRPVNMQFGPDGSLYIADFYNRIIGHYEVPLKHPGRDRHRGRIWKVSYTGTPGHPAQSHPPFNLTRLSVQGVFDELKSHNLVRRNLAMNYLIDSVGSAAIPHARSIVTGTQASSWQERTHALWLLHRMDALDYNDWRHAAEDPTREVRVHAMRVLSETPQWSATQRSHVIAGLHDPDLVVQRAAADALTSHPHQDHVSPLLRALETTPSSTPHLRHTLRIALRNQLRTGSTLEHITQERLSSQTKTLIADVAIAIPSPAAARFLVEYLTDTSHPSKSIRQWTEHIARHADQNTIEKLPNLIRQAFGEDLDQQLVILEALELGSAQRGGEESPAITRWAMELATQMLDENRQSKLTWTHRPVPGMKTTRLPWIVQRRRSADGDIQSNFLCSLSPGGEQFTGLIRSPAFPVPAQLSFYLAGHDGYPDKPVQGRNYVALRLVDSDQTIATATPPRNDTAQKVTWDLSTYEGKQAVLEVTDSDDAGAFAWLAIGRFSSPRLSLPSLSPQYRGKILAAAARIVGSKPKSELFEQMKSLLGSSSLPSITRAEIATALCQSHPDPLSRTFAKRLADAALTEAHVQSLVTALFADDFSSRIPALLQDLIGALPSRSQSNLIQDLVVNRHGAEVVLELVEDQHIPASLLTPSSIQQRLRRHGTSLVNRLEHQIEDLPKSTVNLATEIQSLSRQLSARTGDRGQGQILFSQACQICHQIAGQGTLVGPQLDGIGNRGIERLLEDILDPNRNVDQAFKTQTLTLNNGDVQTGLYRREQGDLLVFANAAGQEFTIPKNDIARRTNDQKSLMPENFHELLTPEQLSDLVTFLLNTGK